MTLALINRHVAVAHCHVKIEPLGIKALNKIVYLHACKFHSVQFDLKKLQSSIYINAVDS